MTAITEAELREEVEVKGKTLAQISEERKVGVPWLSRLCKRWNIKSPPPGRRPGYQHDEEYRQRMSDKYWRRANEGQH